MERVSIVEEGISQYIKVNVSQTLGIKDDAYVPEKETKLHVYNVAKDPKELPITEDITTRNHDNSKPVFQKASKDTQNNNMWKYMTVKEKIQTITTWNNQIPDIELSSKDKEILRKLELEHEENIKSKAADSVLLPTYKAQKQEHVHAEVESEEKLKSKLPVKPKQSVNIKIIFHFLCLIFVII